MKQSNAEARISQKWFKGMYDLLHKLDTKQLNSLIASHCTQWDVTSIALTSMCYYEIQSRENRTLSAVSLTAKGV